MMPSTYATVSGDYEEIPANKRPRLDSPAPPRQLQKPPVPQLNSSYDYPTGSKSVAGGVQNVTCSPYMIPVSSQPRYESPQVVRNLGGGNSKAMLLIPPEQTEEDCYEPMNEVRQEKQEGTSETKITSAGVTCDVNQPYVVVNHNTN